MPWRYDPLSWWAAYSYVARSTAIVVATWLLFGCTADVVKPVTSACPPIRTYDQPFQLAFADELTLMHSSGNYPHVETFVVDSVKLRQVLKACQ